MRSYKPPFEERFSGPLSEKSPEELDAEDEARAVAIAEDRLGDAQPGAKDSLNKHKLAPYSFLTV